MADFNKDQTRIFLWIIPRSNSTALTKCMSFVDDLQIWMEPYMACFLNEAFGNPDFKKGDPNMDRSREIWMKNEETETMKRIRAEMVERIARNPGVIAQQDISYAWVKEQLEKPEPGKKCTFIKDQSGAIADYLWYLPEVPCRHTFLIRHPRELFISLKESVSKRVNFDEIPWDKYHLGNMFPLLNCNELYETHYKMWKHFSRDPDSDPIILDAYDLVSQPEVVLPKFFQRLGIPFKPSYLEWDSDDAILETWKGSADMVFLEAKTITTARATRSSRFIPPTGPRGTPSKPELRITEELQEYIETSMPFYEEMYKNRIY